MKILSTLAMNRDAKAREAIATLSQKIARRIASLWFHKRGADISCLIPEMAEEAAGGIGLAIAEHGFQLSSIIGGEFPREIVRAGFAAAQRNLRRMAPSSVTLVSWDDAMHLADSADKDMLDALRDSLVRRDKRAAVIAKARAMIRAARAFHTVNPSRKRDAALRADLRNIRRATSYMIRHVLGDSSLPFEFAFSMRWNAAEKNMQDSLAKGFAATMKRAQLGTLVAG